MSFDSLPLGLLVKIFHQLPFKDRVRLGGVNQQFNYASNVSINNMKRLDVTDDLVTYTIKNQTFSSLLESCASTLESIDASHVSCSRLLLKEIASYVYPNLKHLEIMDIDEESMKKLISRNRKVRSIGIHLRREFEWPDDIVYENLEELEISVIDWSNDYVNLSSTLCPLVGNVPNLKIISIKTGLSYGFVSAQEFSQLVSSTPILEKINLFVDGRTDPPYFDLLQAFEAAIPTWQLPFLTSLQVDFVGGDFRIPSSVLHNFPASFPQLKSFSSNVIKEIDDQAIVALSHLEYLRELRLPYLDITKIKFSALINSLPSIAVLEIGTVKLSDNVEEIDGQAGGGTNNVAFLLLFQPNRLPGFHLSATHDELVDMIAKVSSISVLQIRGVLDVSLRSFVDFLVSVFKALFGPLVEPVHMVTSASGYNPDLNEMNAVFKEMEKNGEPRVISYGTGD